MDLGPNSFPVPMQSPVQGPKEAACVPPILRLTWASLALAQVRAAMKDTLTCAPAVMALWALQQLMNT